KKAEREAHEIMNSAIEKVEKETEKLREEALKDASQKAATIKPLDEHEMLEIFEQVLKEEFKL
ncbi:MAG: hypothetical protein QXD02_01270, partial [Candidatus Parvarchaeum sp.]|nr:hypothetical protein [Candidatus Parvarchaeum tengchongense]